MANPLVTSPFKGTKGLRRIVNAMGYSMAGLCYAWKGEAAFRQVLLLAIAGIAAIVMLKPSTWAIALIVLCHFLCVIIELINSAIEAAVDHTSLAHHELAKRAKDLGSAAQMVGLIMLFVAWVIGFMARGSP